MSNMTEIAGTGFFYSHKPDGGIEFGQMSESAIQPVDPDTFASAFGRQVASKPARKEAQNILGQLNSSRRTNIKLAEFDNAQQTNAAAGTLLGGM